MPKRPDPNTIHAGVVVPVYNNHRTVASVVGDVAALGFEVIVVNDGSTDATPDELARVAGEATSVAVETHPGNRGKGAALRTGFAAAEQRGWTHALTMDADGQLDAGDLLKLLKAAERHPQALVIGQRAWAIEGCPRRSHIGRGLANASVWAETGLKLSDTQCGLRCYPLGLIRAAACRSGRFEWETEIIARAAWCGFEVVPAPVGCRYVVPGGRVTHFRVWSDTMRSLRLHAGLLRERLVQGMSRAPALPTIREADDQGRQDEDRPAPAGQHAHDHEFAQ